MDDDEDEYYGEKGTSPYQEDELKDDDYTDDESSSSRSSSRMPSTPPWRNQQDILEDDDMLLGGLQGTPILIRNKQLRDTDFSYPFYPFVIVLLKQFIELNLNDQTQVTSENVKRLTNDIVVNLFYQLKSLDKILLELPKYILILRYAKPKKFTSLVDVLNDPRFYIDTRNAADLLAATVDNDYEKFEFGIDLYQNTLRYIQTRFGDAEKQKIVEQEARFKHIDQTNQAFLIKRQMEQQEIEKEAERKRKKQDDGQAQAQQNKEKIARIMASKSTGNKRNNLFNKDKSGLGILKRTFHQELNSANKKLYNNETAKATKKKDKLDDDYKTKFIVGQTIKVYFLQDKKWHLASIAEIKAEGLVVQYEENKNEELIKWSLILQDKNNLVKIITKEDKDKVEEKTFVNTKEAMRKGGGFSPTCSGGKCDTCSMVIEKEPFQSFKKKGKGKNMEFNYLMFCSVGCMEKSQQF